MSPYILDFGFVVVVLISLAIGIGRGFVRSILSVVSWVVSAWITWRFAESVIVFLEPLGISEGLQRPVAYIGVFFLSLLAASIISTIIANSLVSRNVVSVDKTLGAAFGILRGLLIVLVLIIVGSITVYVDEPWWRESIAVRLYDPWVYSIRDWLSDILAAESVASASTATVNSQQIHFESSSQLN